MQNPPSQREYWSGKTGDDWASYTQQIDTMLAPIAAAVIEAGVFQPGERVLDIGCGAGGTSIEIARRMGAKGAVVGVDLSPQLLRVARDRARQANVKAEFIEADAGAEKFDYPFDVAFSRFGVMFFEAPAPAFAHIRGAMRDGGRLVFVCWRAMSENAWATVPLTAIQPMLKAPLPPPDPDAPGPYSLADPHKAQRILSEAAWRNIALARWDGDILIGGGGSVEEAADFALAIGPFARAIADQGLDPQEARRRLIDHLAPYHRNGAVALPGACWIVTANA